MGSRGLFFLASLMILITACSPEPIYRLTPEKGPSTFHKGVEYITLEKDGIVVTMAYYRHMDDLLALDIEVFNNSDEPTRVDPANFGYRAFKHYSDSALTGFITHRWALDPEQELLEIDKNISRHYASQKTADALFLTAVGLGAVAEIADGPDDGNETDNEIEISYVNHEIRQDNFEYEMASLEQKREIWELETLRITDLSPDNYVRGLVFFPNQPEAKGYEMEIKIEGITFVARYKQNKIKP